MKYGKIIEIITQVQYDTIDGINRADISRLEKIQTTTITKMMGEEIKKRIKELE